MHYLGSSVSFGKGTPVNYFQITEPPLFWGQHITFICHICVEKVNRFLLCAWFPHVVQYVHTFV